MNDRFSAAYLNGLSPYRKKLSWEGDNHLDEADKPQKNLT